MSLLHVWSKFPPKEPDAVRRHVLAQSTWTTQPWKDCGVYDGQLDRLFGEGKRQFPYMRDLFDHAAKGRDDLDILVYTNADIGVVSNFCWRIALAMQINDAGYSNRRDAHHTIAAVPQDDDIRLWNNYAGTDTFFFRIGWWHKHRTIMPDMLVAREAWDACLRVLIELSCNNKPLGVPDLTWHERHGGDGHWEGATLRYTLPGQKYNLGLAIKFLMSHNLDPKSFGIRPR